MYSKLKNNVRMIVGDVNTKIGREEMFRLPLTTGGESKHSYSRDNDKQLIELRRKI